MRGFAKGDIVRHTSRFLRSVAWHLNVPINGRVEGVVEPTPGLWGGEQLVRVLWCDQDEVISILASNIELDPRVPR